MDQRVEKVIAMMRHDVRQTLPLREMAEAVNLSPTRLCYLFRVETGTPPVQYLRSMKMHAATTLLATTLLRVKEITAQVGFNDESHFVKDFRRIYGKTPTQYRRQTAIRDT